ncbi:hypothetical protein EDD85DRAFT_923423 [Armillaria nabsnona]|nr:hypothetical protein EDD85DRAFT_923423 [Armillaria nabsnona]
MFSTSSISGPITLESAGLLVLADLPAVASRTALTGGASFLDALVLVPGMLKQQSAEEINRGEFPTTGAMTTDYVFRVENPATVSYLQSIGKTGHLVTARVSQSPSQNPDLSVQNRVLQSLFVAGVPATVLYLLCPISTITVFTLLGVIGDWWGFGTLGMFALASLINVRLQGSINDLKASFSVMTATTLVYASAILAFNASTMGSMLIGGLLLCSVALLTLCNSSTRCLQMYDCLVQKEGEPNHYMRRRDMAEKLVDESKRDDWAVGMGLILPTNGLLRPVTV